MIVDSEDLLLQRRIGERLLETAPSEVNSIIMRAALHEDDGACRFEFDYVDKRGELKWLDDVPGSICHDITRMLIAHRKFFVSKGQPAWLKCVLTIDIEHGKVSMDLEYD